MDRHGPVAAAASSRAVAIPVGRARVQGDLTVPARAVGVVVFAHGSGSGRHSPRNRHVAARLVDAGLATLLIDLLTAEEEAEDLRTRRLRFDIALLSSRLVTAVEWLRGEQETAELPAGCFGASTGAAAALVAAAGRPDEVRAVVSRGGRPDLAGGALHRVDAPTLLIVGGADAVVIELNRDAMEHLHCEVALEVVEGAGHLFEEPGALDRVADLAADWFAGHLGSDRGPGGGR
jgi:putative phosphoribosyl transferase